MQGKVSVGLATVTGYSVSTVAFVGAVLAYLGGDHSDQTVAIIGCGVVGALAFVVTNVGRYLQARSVIKYGPWQVSSKTLDVEKSETTTSSSGNAGLPASWDTPYPPTGSTAAATSINYSLVPDPDGPGDPLPDDLADVPAPAVRPNDVGDGESA